MDHKTNKTETPAHAIGVGRDIRRMKADSADTAAELTEFLRQFRGKRPQEVLGLVARTRPLWATGLATVATVLLMAVFTVVPFVWGKAFPEQAKSGEQAPTAAATADQPAANNTAANAATSDSAAGAAATDPNKPVETEAVAEMLGVGETVESDPGKNPLEESADDLLDDIK
jgi:hypothetical protein